MQCSHSGFYLRADSEGKRTLKFFRAAILALSLIAAIGLIHSSGLAQSGTDSEGFEFRDTSPVWSPKCDQIAFGSTRNFQQDVWLVDLLTEELQNVSANSQTYDYDPKWSPDGTKLAYTSEAVDTSRTDVIVNFIDADTPNLVIENAEYPDWSESDEIVFSRTEGATSNLWVVELNNADREIQITDFKDDAQLVRPSWSADGRYIAFFKELYTGSPTLWILDWASKDTFEVENESTYTYVAWSPNTAQFAGHALDENRGYIGLLSLDGQETNVTKEIDGIPSFPSWSPTGDQLAFMVQKNETFEIWTRDLVVGTITNLSSTSIEATRPAWSPCDDMIAVESRTNEPSSIFLIDSDGKNATNLTGES